MVSKSFQKIDAYNLDARLTQKKYIVSSSNLERCEIYLDSRLIGIICQYVDKEKSHVIERWEVVLAAGIELTQNLFSSKALALKELLATINCIEYWWEKNCIQPLARKVFCNGVSLHLTKTEFDLLLLLVTQSKRYLNYEIIIKKVFGEDYICIYSVNNISVHLSNIKRKFKKENHQLSVYKVFGVGFIFEAEVIKLQLENLQNSAVPPGVVTSTVPTIAP